jgi:hypothetical protein
VLVTRKQTPYVALVALGMWMCWFALQLGEIKTRVELLEERFIEQALTERYTIYERDLSAERDTIIVDMTRGTFVPAEIAIAVSHAENHNGDSTAVSPAGAIGLMQVMPTVWGRLTNDICGGGDPAELLLNRHCNVAVGVAILMFYYVEHGNWDTALRAYNGALAYPMAGDRYVEAVERHYGQELER